MNVIDAHLTRLRGLYFGYCSYALTPQVAASVADIKALEVCLSGHGALARQPGASNQASPRDGWHPPCGHGQEGYEASAHYCEDEGQTNTSSTMGRWLRRRCTRLPIGTSYSAMRRRLD